MLGLEQDFGLSVFELDTIPPEMMKGTQSHQPLNDFEKDPPVEKTVVRFRRTSFSGETYNEAQNFVFFQKSVSESRRISPNEKPVNLYVDQKRLSFIVHLIGQFFMKESPKPKPSCCKTLFPDDNDDDDDDDDETSVYTPKT